MEQKKTVDVTKISAFIPFNVYIINFGNPVYVININDLKVTYQFVQKLSTKQVLVKDIIHDEYVVFRTENLVVKDTVVRFNEIKDYANYQLELNFKDEHI